MTGEIYRKLREIAQGMASTLPEPALYRECAAAVRRADETLRNHGLIAACRTRLDEAALECAHGVCHCEAVARDAGAIVLIEGPGRGVPAGAIERLSVAAEVAGLLHDIKRKEQDHALLGSIEARNILDRLGVDGTLARYITEAIRNHEAFKEIYRSENAEAGLVSDALYDADKFRWGPENFTATLWLMVEARGTPPRALHRTFREKMKGIEQIKGTFRTAVGRKYGPEFIDRGILIGNAIYNELTAMLAGGA